MNITEDGITREGDACEETRRGELHRQKEKAKPGMDLRCAMLAIEDSTRQSELDELVVNFT